VGGVTFPAVGTRGTELWVEGLEPIENFGVGGWVESLGVGCSWMSEV